MALTLSFSKGDVAIRHDLRINLEQNVDPSLTHRNEIMVDRLKTYGYDVERYTDERFKDYIDKYNEGKYPCRQITGGYSAYLHEKNQSLEKSEGLARKGTPLALEFVVQVGNRDTNPAGRDTDESDIERNKHFFKEFTKRFQKKFPHVEILLATFHADEPDGTPHLHMLVQFVGEGYKKGLSHQVSISKALECDGIERGGSRRTGYSMSRWAKDVEDNLMEPFMKEVFHEEREILDEKRSHDDTPVFRMKAKKEQEHMERERERFEKDRDEIAYEVSKKGEELTSLKEQIEEEKNNYDTFKGLESILSELDSIEKNIHDVQDDKRYKEPDQMIIKTIPAKKNGLTGKVKEPVMVVISRKNFDFLKKRANDFIHLSSLLKKVKSMLEKIMTPLKNLFNKKEEKERIKAQAMASEIVKETERAYDELNEANRNVEYILDIERRARNSHLDPEIWDEYIRLVYTRGDMPGRTLGDMVRDIEWYHENEKDAFKEMMETVKEFKDDIDQCIRDSGDTMLLERLRLMEEAYEKEKKSLEKAYEEKSSDDHEDR